MSVRHALLAILDQGPCYGYQLRSEYARRTGATVNVGQVYTTLERLERDGLVGNRGADERGHVYWGITAAGRADVAGWLARPSERTGRDELALKIALAATLPGVDAKALIAAQRAAAVDRLEQVDGDPAASDDVAGGIVEAARRAHARAEVEWLDAASTAVGEDPALRAFALSAERPRRGRPARVAPQAG